MLKYNGQQFSDGISKCILLNEYNYILIKMSLQSEPNCLIGETPALA